jgi:murein DD-endopeptidase MepM/ murein hydrolase activator NlpD
LITVVALVVGAFVWRANSDRAAAADPTAFGGPSTTVSLAGAGISGDDAVVPDPTPVLASYGDVVLRVPVPLWGLTEVMFHQASYGYALHMATQMPYAELSSAANKIGTGRDITMQETGPNAVLVGNALRIYRTGRSGEPDTAVDVGADAGTPVFAPVTGTVVKVKEYLLYGKYADNEIHIQPDGHPELDLVIIHVADVTAIPGDRVIAGVTQIATVRLLSDRLNEQLGEYTTGSGDHVHVQINDVNHPEYKGLEGAISVTAQAATED